jgi:MFS family permease
MGLVPRLPRAAWLVLGGDLLSALGSGMTMPFFIVYLHRVRGIDLTVASLALATTALASFAGNVLGGALADRVGPRRALMCGVACQTAGLTFMAFVTSAPEAFGAAALIGLGTSTAWPALDALLATTVDESQRSSAFALRHGTLNLGFGGGALIAATIVTLGSTHSFQLLYVVDAATSLAFVPLLASLRSIGGRVESDEPSAGGYREVLADRTFLAVWGLAALFVAFGFGQYEAALPPYATGTGGISAHALGYVFAANTLSVAVLQLVMLRVLAGRRRTSALAAAGAAFAAAWCITITAAQAGSVAVFACAMAVLAIGETMISPALAPIVNDLAPDHLRGRYNGAFVLAYTTGFMVGPALAGGGLRIGDGTAFVGFLAVGCMVAAAWSLTLRRRLPESIDRIGDHRVEVPLQVEPA